MSETPDTRYPVEVLDEDEDCGVMPDNVAALSDAVVGRKIVKAEIEEAQPTERTWRSSQALTLTLDDGTRVQLVDTDDCCAYTSLNDFLAHPERFDHAILGVGTTGGYTKWHIYADLGDVLELDVGWSPGNPFYYGYGFDITVVPAEDRNFSPGSHEAPVTSPDTRTS